MTNEREQQQPTPFEKFRNFTQRVVSVPKAEIDRREKEYQRIRKQRRQQEEGR